jgi:GNAT superfamily N-acetyltransferase
MELTWLDPAAPDERVAVEALSLLEAAREADRPYHRGTTLTPFLADLRHGWDGDPTRLAIAHDEHGRAVGVLRWWVSTWDNTHLASLYVTVDPLLRRRGIGRELFQLGVDLVRDLGKRVLTSMSVDGSAGAGFLKAMGLDPVYHEVNRRLEIATVDWARLARDAAAAAPYAEGYDLVRLTAPLPAELLGPVAAMTAAINDAPTGSLDMEDEVFSDDRIRAYERAQEAGGGRIYRVVARHRGSGELAGQSVAVVEGERPWLVAQRDTSVVRAHRGHRLGLLLKVEMLRWLREQEPQARQMDTGNAADNAHMIAVNEQLGYRVLDRVTEWQRRW